MALCSRARALISAKTDVPISLTRAAIRAAAMLFDVGVITLLPM
jgi:hypothetical protein